MKIFTKNCKMPKRQEGAVLVVGLILLVVVTVLAVSGMNTATTELAMARNHQNYENAFQAAETGLERSLAQGRYNPEAEINLVQNVNVNDTVSALIEFADSTSVPDDAFSLGIGSGVSAYHFVATATAKSKREGITGGVTDRDASAVHIQGFYVVGPEAPPLSPL